MKKEKCSVPVEDPCKHPQVTYVGETARKLAERVGEYCRAYRNKKANFGLSTFMRLNIMVDSYIF